MRKSRIKAKLRRNEQVLLTTLHFGEPSLYEMISLMGIDGIWMDLEHHPFSLETAAQLMRAVRVGSADVLARPAKGEFMRMGRLLEAGAQGIMYPRCDSAEEAAEVVRWAKFAPQGTRGIDGGNPDMPYLSMPLPEYLREANEQTFLVVQLEDPAALDNVEEIANVDGVDVVFLGPGDFSILAGVPGQFDHPIVLDATKRVAAAAKAAGKHWGCPAFSADHTRKLLDQGARFICHQADIVVLKQAYEKILQDFAELGFSYERRMA